MINIKLNSIPSLNKGITLIELMIVVAIVAILSSVAIPSYQNYALGAKRSEGTSALTQIMSMQERYYINNFPPTYTKSLTDLGLAAAYVTENGYYNIKAEGCGDGIEECVLLTAVAQKGQTEDGDLTLNSLGQQTRDGNAGGWSD